MPINMSEITKTHHMRAGQGVFHVVGMQHGATPLGSPGFFKSETYAYHVTTSQLCDQGKQKMCPPKDLHKGLV